MKNLRIFVWMISFTFLLTSCGMVSKMFPRKTGCPSNGKNVDAGKLANGDPKAERLARKAKKFRS